MYVVKMGEIKLYRALDSGVAKVMVKCRAEEAAGQISTSNLKLYSFLAQ